MPQTQIRNWPLINRRSARQEVVLDRSRKLISLMSHHWFQQFASRFQFPRNYVTVDIETNGTNHEQDLICSIGHTVVREGRPVETSEAYLNWTLHPDIDQAALRASLIETQRVMESKGKPFHHTLEKLQADGQDPVMVLRAYLDMFEDMEARREVLVTHNGWRFDIEFLQAHFHNYLRIPFVFDQDLVFDTGIATKASQLEDYDDPLPVPGETMRQWAWRIGDLRRRGIFWALDGYCDEQFGLFKKAGVSSTLAHTAGTDSLVLAYLFEEHRKLAGLASHVDMSTDEPQRVIVPNES